MSPDNDWDGAPLAFIIAFLLAFSCSFKLSFVLLDLPLPWQFALLAFLLPFHLLRFLKFDYNAASHGLKSLPEYSKPSCLLGKFKRRNWFYGFWFCRVFSLKIKMKLPTFQFILNAYGSNDPTHDSLLKMVGGILSEKNLVRLQLFLGRVQSVHVSFYIYCKTLLYSTFT